MHKIQFSLGERLKDIRTYFDYTQDDIAKVLDISRPLYASFEANARIISLHHLVTLANYYKMSIDSMLGFKAEYKNINYKITLNIDIISRNLKLIRQEMNLSTSKLAEKLGYGSSTINDYETGKTMISTAYLYDLARLSNISTDYILGMKVKKYIKNDIR